MKYRKVTQADSLALSDYYVRNETHFKPWQPKTESGYHDKKQWQQRINTYLASQNEGSCVYFVAVDMGKIVGNCTLSQISRGAFQACYIGYGVCYSVEGKGVAYKLVSNALTYAFDTLKLNRVMANYMPHNNRSARLLNKLGFVREGIARNYLKINGRWEDHVLTAMNKIEFEHALVNASKRR